MRAAASVSLESTFSETTKRSRPPSAARTRSARGSETAGFVAITQSARMRPTSTASIIATAFSPSACASRGAFQKRWTRSISAAE